MTRRGSLVYYLAAWVCGCFFMAATIWLQSLWVGGPVDRSSSLLFVYFLELMSGALPLLFFGFVLRRAAGGMHWSRAWHWLTGGAILAVVMTALLGYVGSWQTFQASGWRDWISGYVLSSSAIYMSPAWMSIITAPAGAATAWVLFRIHCAFAGSSIDTAV